MHVCAGASDRFNCFRWRELARHESAKDVPTELAKKDRDKHFRYGMGMGEHVGMSQNL